MNILIPTEPDDVHAVLVKLALEEKGHCCTLWFTADMPSKQANSIYFLEGSSFWVAEDKIDNLQITSNSFDVVWWRRPRQSAVEKTCHENDYLFIKKENALFHDSLPWVIAKTAWWINP